MGIWYLPNDKENQISGTLNIEENGKITLEVMYGFSSLSNIFKSVEIKVIHGRLPNGKDISLFDSLQTNVNFNMPGYPTVVYSPRFAIIGNLYNSLDEVVISEMKATYSNLGNWLNIRPFHIDSDKGRISVDYQVPDSIRYRVGDNEEIEFSFKGKINTNHIDSYAIEQSEVVRFCYKIPVKYEQALDSASQFSDFLTLCIGVKTDILTIQAQDDKGEDVKFIMNMNSISEGDIKEEQIYLQYTSIKDVFEDCYKQWKNKQDSLGPLIWYFIEAHDRGFHIPMSFLKSVQAIEAYSRRLRNNERMPENEFIQWVNSIVSKVENKEDEELIKSIISNEPRLRDRLREIFSEINYLLNISSKKRKSLINKIVNTRNYYTHFDEGLKSKAMSSDMIYYVTILLKSVMRILLMQELGLKSDSILQYFKHDQQLLFVKEKLGYVTLTEPVTIKIDKKDS